MLEARKKKDMTQQKLSDLSHVSVKQIANIEKGKMLYSSCPPEMRDTLLHHTQEMVKELTELSEKFETN